MDFVKLRCLFCGKKKSDRESLASHVVKRHNDELVRQALAQGEYDPEVVTDVSPPSPPPPTPQDLTQLSTSSLPPRAGPLPVALVQQEQRNQELTPMAKKLCVWARIMFEKYYCLPEGKSLSYRARLLALENDPNPSAARTAKQELAEMFVIVNPYLFVAKKAAIMHLFTKEQTSYLKETHDNKLHLLYHGQIILAATFPDYDALLHLVRTRPEFKEYLDRCSTKGSLDALCRAEPGFLHKVLTLFKGVLYNPSNFHGQYTKENMQETLLRYCRFKYSTAATKESSIIGLINIKVCGICKKFPKMGKLQDNPATVVATIATAPLVFPLHPPTNNKTNQPDFRNITPSAYASAVQASIDAEPEPKKKICYPYVQIPN